MESTKFDKKKCMSTIYAIAKEKGIKIGDLEKNAGASAGYLSKLSSDGNTATPSIELLLAIADNLGVTIDMLVKTEYDELSENEKYVLKFLDRLIKETKSGVLGWSKDTKNQLLEVGYKEEDGQYIAEHPLFCVDS